MTDAFKVFDNKTEMTNYLKMNCDDYYIFGESSHYPKTYCCTRISLNNQNYYCGIINQNPFKPDIILINDIIYLGINNEVYTLKNGTSQILYENDSCFFEFIGFNNSLVAVFETCIVCFCEEKKMWDYQFHDIVTEYSMQDGLLIVELDSNNTKIFNELGLQC